MDEMISNRNMGIRSAAPNKSQMILVIDGLKPIKAGGLDCLLTELILAAPTASAVAIVVNP